MNRKYFLALALIFLPLIASADRGNKGRWGDQGDGTYKNPVLPGDFSDPDVIRVGDDFYFITSTFQYSPGIAILHSRDLVNWQYIGHAVSDLNQIGPELNYDRMNRPGRGIWAGAIRFHAGKFYIYFTTPDEGVFMTTAINPAGPWASLTRLWDGSKLHDDPCPFWDDDGKAYLLLSDPVQPWVTSLYSLSPDGRTLDTASRKVIDDFRTSEGNKLYKINGMYYIFHNEVRNKVRVGVMMRSKTITGPYEKKMVLHDFEGQHRDREPNQGGLIQLASGEWYFITQQGQGGSYDGRPSSLLPVRWINGWPILGMPDSTGTGTIPWTHKKPIAGQKPHQLQTSDEFEDQQLGPQWEWNYQPRAGMWSLREHPGFLRLHAFRPIEPGNLLKAGNTLTQRTLGLNGGEITIKMNLSGMADGQQAGLAHYAKTYAMVGIQQRGSKRFLIFSLDGTVTPGPEVDHTTLWLRSIVDADGLAHAQYSLDGTFFSPIGTPFQLTWANYRGDRIALYSFNDLADKGYADFNWFHYIPFNADTPGSPASPLK